MDIAVACLAAWVFGGIPFGLVLVRLCKGIDIRSIGSGNVGATNASRAFVGKARLPFFLAIYLLDFAKGFLPAFYGPDLLGRSPDLDLQVWLGASAVVGHCASPFLRLRGGKGVATMTGVFAALDFYALLIALGAFFLVLALTRRVFWGSLALGLGLAAAVILRDPQAAFAARMSVSILAIACAAFLFWTHRSNLRGFFSNQGRS
ncbi:MAG: glycerol-3-phosphate acyltransferase [Planctomycetota bacterium]